MARPEGQGCASCRFMEMGKVMNVEHVADGMVRELVNGLVCRRYPPRVMRIGDTYQKTLPVVAANDWCGEWLQA